MENRKLGAEIFLPLSNRKVYRIEISFVDDTDMYSNGELSAKNIQMIMDIYTRLYEATGGKIQEEKIIFYSWIWELLDRVQVIKDVKVQIKVYYSEIL